MQLVKSSHILNFLTAQPEFWYWSIRKIMEIYNGIEFHSFKLKEKDKIQVIVDKKGFNVKLLHEGLLRNKLKREFKNVSAIDLHEIINHLIFIEKKNAA